MSGGKGKSHGGKAGPKGAADGSRQQVSHSAKAGLQVRNFLRFHMVVALGVFWGTKRLVRMGKARAKIQQMMKERFLFFERVSVLTFLSLFYVTQWLAGGEGSPTASRANKQTETRNHEILIEEGYANNSSQF